MEKINIGLVEDHFLVREGFATIISRFDNCHVVLEAGNGKELQKIIYLSPVPDILFLDVSMPEMDGYETAAWLKEHFPLVRIIILTMLDSDLAIFQMLQFEVRGFLKKNIRSDELRQAIDLTMTIGYAFTASVTRKLIKLLAKKDQEYHQDGNVKLSDKEMLFLKFACSGKTYKEIAVDMDISVRTVENYRDSLFAKLNFKSRVELALYAVKTGLVLIGM